MRCNLSTCLQAGADIHMGVKIGTGWRLDPRELIAKAGVNTGPGYDFGNCK